MNNPRTHHKIRYESPFRSYHRRAGGWNGTLYIAVGRTHENGYYTFSCTSGSFQPRGAIKLERFLHECCKVRNEKKKDAYAGLGGRFCSLRGDQMFLKILKVFRNLIQSRFAKRSTTFENAGRNDEIRFNETELAMTIKAVRKVDICVLVQI